MNAEKYVYLVGAGISIDSPSGIPPGAPILHRLIKYVSTDASTEKALRDYADPEETRKHGRSRTNFLRFEGLIERISDIEPSIFSTLAKLETYGRPNAMHKFLADQANAGALVLTTNFDCRIEQAALDSQLELHRFVIGQPISKLKSNTQLIKLHGSFSHPHFRAATGKPIATLTQIARFGLAFSSQRGLRKHLEKCCAGRTLIVAGYSASDSFDVTPMIEKLPWHSVIWLRHDKEAKPDLELDPQAAGVFGEQVLFDQPLDILCLNMLAKSAKEEVIIRSGPTASLLLGIAGKSLPTQGDLSSSCINDNLSALDTALAQRSLDVRKRSFICNALLDESYGQMSDVVVGETFDFDDSDEALERNWEKVGQLLDARSFVQALATIEEIFDGDDTYYTFEARLKAKLEFAEYMFNDLDLANATDTVLAVEHLARARGCAWALVQSQQLLAKYELDVALHKSGAQQRSLLRKVLVRQTEAIYYALRCGFIDDAFDTLRLLILTKNRVGDTELTVYLDALNTIFPYVQSPEILFSFYEEQVSLAIDKDDSSSYRRSIIALNRRCSKISGDVCTASVSLFRGRWHLRQGRKYLARRWLANAKAICADRPLSRRFAARIRQLALELDAP